MYEIIANLLKESKKTTVITGDGISIDSQKIDYKTSVDNQVYNGINLSKLCNKDFDKSDNNFISYYRNICKQISLNKPNKAHHIIEEWKNKKIRDLVITQNIDGYHGIKNVIELHGNINNFYCTNCKKKFNSKYYQKSHKCNNGHDNFEKEYTKCNGTLRPNIVLSGEIPKYLELALFNMYKSDIVLIIGTEMSISPINKLPVMAKEKGAKLVAINKEPIESIANYINYSIYGEDIIDVLEKLNNLIL